MNSAEPNDIEQLAQMVERLGMVAPAVVLLEACKPLHRLAGHAFDLIPQNSSLLEHPFSKLLRDRACAEALIARLERGGAAA